MAKIIVFCDGTWNDPDIVEPTSVHKLYQSLRALNDPSLRVIYFKGIGTTDEFDSNLQKWLGKWGGGAFGWGLDGKVKQAYQFLSMVYQPGDEIQIFGFSRGAYTARSVAGMIRKCGLLAEPSVEGINRAFALYRKRGASNHPDKDHIWQERRQLSPRFATSQTDLDKRGDDGSEMVNLGYLGVFDTVGARGIPPALLGPLAVAWNSQYRFHDTDLSSLVKAARHAIAVDERRVFYKPARWDNLPRLNAGDQSEARPYQQCWFVGTHGILGGSSETAQELSIIPQNWVLEGAKLPLRVDTSTAAPLHPTDEIDHSWGMLKQWRTGPQKGDSIHPSVVTRATGLPDYRPKTLARNIAKWLGQ